MKLREIIERIDKSKNNSTDFDLEDLCKELDISYNGQWFDYDLIDDRLKVYYINSWLCTDTWVGTKAYFLDDIFVAYSYQPARKSSEIFEWVSEFAFFKTREYIRSFLVELEIKPTVEILDLDKEIKDTYKLEYNEQLFDYHKDKAHHRGKKVEIVQCDRWYKDFPNKVRIKLEDGDIIDIVTKDLDFTYNII